MRRGAGAGFTLIELLIVIAIVGLLAAVAIPNLMNALQRGRQKRTMANIRALATAIEAYQVDEDEYPAAACPSGVFVLPGPRLDQDSFTDLVPTYITQPPFQDGWSRAMRYGLRNTRDAYNLRSMGKDGTLDAAPCGTTTNFNDDIIFSDGVFIQWPEGTQN